MIKHAGMNQKAARPIEDLYSYLVALNMADMINRRQTGKMVWSWAVQRMNNGSEFSVYRKTQNINQPNSSGWQNILDRMRGYLPHAVQNYQGSSVTQEDRQKTMNLVVCLS